MINVLLLSVATSLLLLAAPGVNGLWKRVARAYGAFFTVAFTVRGLLLAIFQPAPRLNSSFAISDMATAGYERSLETLLPWACQASFFFYLGILLVSVFARSRSMPVFAVAPSTATFLVASGTLMRLLAQFTTDLPVVERLGSVGQAISVAVLAGMVIGTNWRDESRKWVLIVAVVECSFSFIEASKTPLLTVALIWYLDPARRRIRIRDVIVLAIAMAAAFTLIQRIKPSGVTDSLIRGTGLSAFALELALSLTSRLDGLFALSAAWVRGPATYIGADSFPAAFLAALTPGWFDPGSKLLSGVVWGREIYGVQNGVSYAEGFSGEGLAVLGPSGPVVWGLIGGLIAGLMTLAIHARSTFLQVMGLTFIASTSSFERGLLGQAEQLSSVTIAAIIVTLVASLIRQLNVSHTKIRDVGSTPGSATRVKRL